MGREEIGIWLAEPPRPASDAWREERLRLLSSEERTRHDAFHFQEDRDLYLSAHTLLRETLSRYTGIAAEKLSFVTDAFGKPRLAGEVAGLQFNLSHTRNLSACVVAGKQACGIDVERVAAKEGLFDVARHHFAREELEQLSRLSRERFFDGFYSLWTLKEALIKGLGQGLRLPLDGFAFRLPESDGEAVELIRYDLDGEAGDWAFRLFSPLPGSEPDLEVGRDDGSDDGPDSSVGLRRYRMAVAVNTGDAPLPPVRIHWVEA